MVHCAVVVQQENEQSPIDLRGHQSEAVLSCKTGGLHVKQVWRANNGMLEELHRFAGYLVLPGGWLGWGTTQACTAPYVGAIMGLWYLYRTLYRGHDGSLDGRPSPDPSSPVS